MARQHQLRWTGVVRVAFVAALVVHGSILLLYASWNPILGEVIFAPLFVGALTLVLGLLATLSKRLRPRAKFIAACASVILLVSVPLVRLPGYVRSLSFHRLADRAQPLVDRIHAYEREHG